MERKTLRKFRNVTRPIDSKWRNIKSKSTMKTHALQKKIKYGKVSSGS